MVSGSGDAGRSSIHDGIEPLDGRLVHLRPAIASDAADVAAIATILIDPSVNDWWQTHDAEVEAADLVADPELALWLVEDGLAVVGLIMASEENEPQYRHAGIDIALNASGQGRGFGPDAVATVARWLIDGRGHHRLTIDPSAANTRAIAAYAKVGFRPVGTLRAYERWLDGAWHDGLLMELLASDLADRRRGEPRPDEPNRGRR